MTCWIIPYPFPIVCSKWVCCFLVKVFFLFQNGLFVSCNFIALKRFLIVLRYERLSLCSTIFNSILWILGIFVTIFCSMLSRTQYPLRIYLHMSMAFSEDFFSYCWFGKLSFCLRLTLFSKDHCSSCTVQSQLEEENMDIQFKNAAIAKSLSLLLNVVWSWPSWY